MSKVKTGWLREAPNSMCRWLVVAAGVATLLVAAAVPAEAGRIAFSDPRGDAPARYDITRVRIVNSDQVLTVQAHVRHLRSRGTQIFVANFSLHHYDYAYWVGTVRHADGRVTTRASGYEQGEQTAVRCHITSSWRIRQSLIAFSLPRDCFHAGTVTSNAAIGVGDGSGGDPTDWTRNVRVPQG